MYFEQWRFTNLLLLPKCDSLTEEIMITFPVSNCYISMLDGANEFLKLRMCLKQKQSNDVWLLEQCEM